MPVPTRVVREIRTGDDVYHAEELQVRNLESPRPVVWVGNWFVLWALGMVGLCPELGLSVFAFLECSNAFFPACPFGHVEELLRNLMCVRRAHARRIYDLLRDGRGCAFQAKITGQSLRKLLSTHHSGDNYAERSERNRLVKLLEPGDWALAAKEANQWTGDMRYAGGVQFSSTTRMRKGCYLVYRFLSSGGGTLLLLAAFGLNVYQDVVVDCYDCAASFFSANWYYVALFLVGFLSALLSVWGVIKGLKSVLRLRQRRKETRKLALLRSAFRDLGGDVTGSVADLSAVRTHFLDGFLLGVESSSTMEEGVVWSVTECREQLVRAFGFFPNLVNHVRHLPLVAGHATPIESFRSAGLCFAFYCLQDRSIGVPCVEYIGGAARAKARLRHRHKGALRSRETMNADAYFGKMDAFIDIVDSRARMFNELAEDLAERETVGTHDGPERGSSVLSSRIKQLEQAVTGGRRSLNWKRLASKEIARMEKHATLLTDLSAFLKDCVVRKILNWGEERVDSVNPIAVYFFLRERGLEEAIPTDSVAGGTVGMSHAAIRLLVKEGCRSLGVNPKSVSNVAALYDTVEENLVDDDISRRIANTQGDQRVAEPRVAADLLQQWRKEKEKFRTLRSQAGQITASIEYESAVVFDDGELVEPEVFRQRSDVRSAEQNLSQQAMGAVGCVETRRTLTQKLVDKFVQTAEATSSAPEDKLPLVPTSKQDGTKPSKSKRKKQPGVESQTQNPALDFSAIGFATVNGKPVFGFGLRYGGRPGFRFSLHALVNANGSAQLPTDLRVAQGGVEVIGKLGPVVDGFDSVVYWGNFKTFKTVNVKMEENPSPCYIFNPKTGSLRPGMTSYVMLAAENYHYSHPPQVLTHSCSTLDGFCGLPLLGCRGEVLAVHHLGNMGGLNGAVLPYLGAQVQSAVKITGQVPAPIVATKSVCYPAVATYPSGFVRARGDAKDVIAETEKFAGDDGVLSDPDRLAEIWEQVSEEAEQDPYVFASDAQAFERMLRAVQRLELTSTCGYPVCTRRDCGTQREFIEALGRGSLTLGQEKLARDSLEVLRKMEKGEIDENIRYFLLSSKLDKYNWKKVGSRRFRGLQQASVHLKVIWLYLFGTSDDAWSVEQVGTPYLTCFDPNGPMWGLRMRMLFFRKKVSIGFDFKNFDRTLSRSLIEPFCKVYLRHILVRAPDGVLDSLFDVLCFSQMVDATGKVWTKERGNPSGMPNTLRMNSVCHRVGEMYIREQLGVDGVSLVLCGDDSLYGVSEDSTADILEQCLPQLWKTEFGMELELEKRVPIHESWEFHAPFVSRTTVFLHGIPVSVLVKPRKIVASILFDPAGIPAEQLYLSNPDYAERVKGVYDALVAHVVARRAGRYSEPVTEWLEATFGLQPSDLHSRLWY